MKQIIACLIVALSTTSYSQHLDLNEVKKVIDNIVFPMDSADIDRVVERTIFPFRVTGSEPYDEKKFRENFDDLFIHGLVRCLKSEANYQVATPGDHTMFLAVCFSAPEGYDAAVLVFTKEDDKWMMQSMDLQNE
jgi:hypothetical protein